MFRPISIQGIEEVEKVKEKRNQFDSFLKDFLMRLSEKDENAKEIMNEIIKEKGLEGIFRDGNQF